MVWHQLCHNGHEGNNIHLHHVGFDLTIMLFVFKYVYCYIIDN